MSDAPTDLSGLKWGVFSRYGYSDGTPEMAFKNENVASAICTLVEALDLCSLEVRPITHPTTAATQEG